MNYGRVDMINAEGDYFGKLMRSAESILAGLIPEVTVEPEVGTKKVYNIKTNTLQQDVEVVGDKITGQLLYCDTDPLKTDWGAGYFLVLKFTNNYESATSIKVGLNPSEGSGLVELLGDPDMNCVAKITNPNTQKFRVEITDGTRTTVQNFDLSGLQFVPV